MFADLVLFNGAIHTMDPAQPRVSALAAHEGYIVYLGDDVTARGMALPHAEVVDLKGACVLPGLADAHLHLGSFAEALSRVDVETPTLEEALRRVQERAMQTPPGQWVLGRGWNHNLWGGRFPTAAQLDRVAPDHPVLLGAKSGHAAWVNSRALAQAGITAETPDPPGGQIVRHADGRPTGLLLEGAMGLVWRVVPETTLDDMVVALRRAIAVANRAGLTSVHDMDGPLALRAEQVLRERGQLSLRILKSIPLEHLEEALALGIRTGLGDEWLRLGQVKMFADGALGPRTAWMLQGYETAPHDTGIPTTEMHMLRQAVQRANAAGLSCAIHAIGDRACREVLDIYEEIRGRYPQCRNRIEHLQILHPSDWARVGQLGVIGSVQPIHATSDMEISDRHLGDRAVGAYVFRSLRAYGAVLAFGSDCPVETIDPLLGIHAAVTRRRRDGSPGPDGWHPEQRLTVTEAVRGFTWGAAYAAGWEKRLGTLALHKLADITILDQDIWAIDPMAIAETRVLGTVVGGRFVWRDAAL